MNPTPCRILAACALLASANAIAQAVAQSAAPAQNALTSVFADVTLPAATYACIALPIPSDGSAAARAIDEAGTRWLDLARADKIPQASATFLHARIPTEVAANPDAPFDAQLCAVVARGTSAPSMTIVNLPARRGTAGFCPNQPQVEPCLAAAAAAAGYGPDKPWPWLPVYARWPATEPAPASAAEVLAQLVAMPISMRSLAPADKLRRFELSAGLQPLLPCEANCSTPAAQSATVASSGPGVGWFIPAASAAN